MIKIHISFLTAVLMGFFCGRCDAGEPGTVFKDALAAWHMDSLNSTDASSPLMITGDVSVGSRLEGEDRAESLQRGGDGIVTVFNGGSLNAGEGQDRQLHLEGNALTIFIRLRALSEDWPGGLIFAKHGGHARTMFNLHVSATVLGFEFGLEEQQLLGGRMIIPLSHVTDGRWHDVAATYDGTEAALFIDGEKVRSVQAPGHLRSNSEPITIGQAVLGEVDHAAIWSRALSSEEIATLSGVNSGVNAASFDKVREEVRGNIQDVEVHRADRILADFEGNDFGDWTVLGDAFGPGPARVDDGGRGKIKGVVGKGYASSTSRTPQAKGKLISPSFLIDRNYLNFVLGGGRVNGASIRLIVGNEIVDMASGWTGDELYPWSFDLSKFQGQMGRLEIWSTIADEKGSRPIHVDHIVLSDQSRLQTMQRTMELTGRYLRLPAARTGRLSTLKIKVDGSLVRQGEYRPPVGNNEDYWILHDVSEYKGKTAEITVENAPCGNQGLADVQSSDSPSELAQFYHERLRPQFHFSPRSGWLNDPNGMLYVNGEWHLFFQHNPFTLLLDSQSWGHAVSRDLVHWEELPTVIQPYTFSRGRSFSGSAVVDKQNRTGLQSGENPLILAFYTDTGYEPRGECLAYSNDLGRTFSYDDKNPLFQHVENGRDPKVFWYSPNDMEQKSGHWVMVVYAMKDRKDGLSILVSHDLRKWEQTDWIAGFYECPELFPLPLLDDDGKPNGTVKWIIQGGDASYSIGSFDGRKFSVEGKERFQTVRLPAYAGQCFNNAPGGRVIQMSWIRFIDWQDMPFSQMMSVPLELSLRSTRQGARLFAEPVRELKDLHDREFIKRDVVLVPGQPLAVPLEGQLYDMEVTFACTPGATLAIKLGQDEVVCDGSGNIEGIPVEPTSEGKVTIRVLVDRPLIEIVGNRGAFYLPKPRKGAGQNCSIELVAAGRPIKIDTLQAFEMKSIWNH